MAIFATVTLYTIDNNDYVVDLPEDEEKLSLELSRLDKDELGNGGSLGATEATSGKRIPRSMSSSLEARTEFFRSRPKA